MSRIYPNERVLFQMLAVVAGLFWLVITLATFGLIVFYLAMGFVGYLFVQSAFIS